MPDIHKIATQKINEAFFDEELEYHFEDYEHTYDINITGEQMVVRNTFDAQVSVNPKCESPVFKQKFTSEFEGNEIKLKDFEVANTPVTNLDEYFQKTNDNPKVFELTYHLEGHSKVRIRRTVEYTQCLRREPYINVVIGRYIKGAILSAKVSNGHKLKFVRSGLGTFDEKAAIGERADGYKTWTLAEQRNLLLPGTGYILIVIPDLAST